MQEAANPFEVCDVVTTTTHKTLRGPRAGLIFFRKVDRATGTTSTGLEDRINFAVFPSTQGGPHNNTIAAIAVALKQAATPEFRAYAKAVRVNAAVLAAALERRGYTICTGGTDNHIVLWDLRPLGLTGSKVEKVCELVHMSINKNSVHGDQSALSPGGIRLGSAALTTRGFAEGDFEQVAELLQRAVAICLAVQKSVSPSKKLKDFVDAIGSAEDQIACLASDVKALARTFPMPGLL